MRTAWSWLLPESAINRMSGPRHWPFIPDFWKGRRPWQQPAIWQGLIKMEPWHTREISGTLSRGRRSEEHTSELQSLMRISYAVFCLKKTTTTDRIAHIQP